LEIVATPEGNDTFTNLQPFCEPQLGKRGLYATTGGHGDNTTRETAMLWVLNFSDGHHSLLDIAERAQLGFHGVREAAERLRAAGLIASATT